MNASSESPSARRSSTFHYGIFGQLSREWHTLSNDDAANMTVARWAAVDPALAGLTTLSLIAGSTHRDEAEVDAMFGALIRRANGDDPEGGLAARVILQLMLPKAAKIAGLYREWYPDPMERSQLAVSSMWSAIREHPARVTHHIPPHLGWTAQHMMRDEIRMMTSEIPIGALGGVSDATDPQEVNPFAALHPSEELSRLLDWAVAGGVISEADAHLLAVRYGSEAPSKGTWKTVGTAPDTGMSPAAMRQRCSRATRRLAEAASAFLSAA